MYAALRLGYKLRIVTFSFIVLPIVFHVSLYNCLCGDWMNFLNTMVPANFLYNSNNALPPEQNFEVEVKSIVYLRSLLNSHTTSISICVWTLILAGSTHTLFCGGVSTVTRLQSGKMRL